MKSDFKKIAKIVAILLIAVAVGVLFYLGRLAYKNNWTATGFVGGKDGPKTLWDWLELMIVPVVLFIVGVWFSSRQSRTARETATNENETNRRIAQNRTQERILQTYLDRMQELMLKENLLFAKPDWPVAELAKARTLTILKFFSGAQRRNTATTKESFGGDRRRLVIEFLYGANLIIGERPFDLFLADLQGAHLEWIYLGWANLEGAILAGAHLEEARLQGANLGWANLEGANLKGANLKGAHLEEAHLEGAILAGTHLEGAILEGTYLERAHLEWARVLPHQFKEVKSLDYAILPDGKKYTGKLPERWGDAWPYHSPSKDK